jgi:hypothetical protein
MVKTFEWACTIENSKKMCIVYLCVWDLYLDVNEQSCVQDIYSVLRIYEWTCMLNCVWIRLYIMYYVFMWLRLVCGCKWTIVCVPMTHLLWVFSDLSYCFSIDCDIFCPYSSVFGISEFFGRNPFSTSPFSNFDWTKIHTGENSERVYRDNYRPFSLLLTWISLGAHWSALRSLLPIYRAITTCDVRYERTTCLFG